MPELEDWCGLFQTALVEANNRSRNEPITLNDNSHQFLVDDPKWQIGKPAPHGDGDSEDETRCTIDKTPKTEAMSFGD